MADFNKQRLFIVIAAGVGVLAAFLPWAKVWHCSESAPGLCPCHRVKKGSDQVPNS